MDHIEDQAQSMSAELQEKLGELAKEFDRKVKETGEQYGLRLITEVSVGIEE